MIKSYRNFNCTSFSFLFLSLFLFFFRFKKFSREPIFTPFNTDYVESLARALFIFPADLMNSLC